MLDSSTQLSALRSASRIVFPIIKHIHVVTPVPTSSGAAARTNGMGASSSSSSQESSLAILASLHSPTLASLSFGSQLQSKAVTKEVQQRSGVQRRKDEESTRPQHRHLHKLIESLDMLCTCLCIGGEQYLRTFRSAEFVESLTYVLIASRVSFEQRYGRNAEHSDGEERTFKEGSKTPNRGADDKDWKGRSSPTPVPVSPSGESFNGSFCGDVASTVEILTARALALIADTVPRGLFYMRPTRTTDCFNILAYYLKRIDFLLVNEDFTEEILKIFRFVCLASHAELVELQVPQRVVQLLHALEAYHLREMCLCLLSRLLGRAREEQMETVWSPILRLLLESFHQFVEEGDLGPSPVMRRGELSGSFALDPSMLENSHLSPASPHQRPGDITNGSMTATSVGASSAATRERTLTKKECTLLQHYMECFTHTCDRLLPQPKAIVRSQHLAGEIVTVSAHLIQFSTRVTPLSKGEWVRSLALAPLVELYLTSPTVTVPLLCSSRAYEIVCGCVLSMVQQYKAAAKRPTVNENGETPQVDGTEEGAGTRRAADGTDTEDAMGSPATDRLRVAGAPSDDAGLVDALNEDGANVSPLRPSGSGGQGEGGIFTTDLATIPFISDELRIVPLLEFLLVMVPVANRVHSHNDAYNVTQPYYEWTWEDDFHNEDACSEALSRRLERAYQQTRENRDNSLYMISSTRRRNIYTDFLNKNYVSDGSALHFLHRRPILCGFVHDLQNGVVTGECKCRCEVVKPRLSTWTTKPYVRLQEGDGEQLSPSPPPDTALRRGEASPRDEDGSRGGRPPPAPPRPPATAGGEGHSTTQPQPHHDGNSASTSLHDVASRNTEVYCSRESAPPLGNRFIRIPSHRATASDVGDGSSELLFSARSAGAASTERSASAPLPFSRRQTAPPSAASSRSSSDRNARRAHQRYPAPPTEGRNRSAETALTTERDGATSESSSAHSPRRQRREQLRLSRTLMLDEDDDEGSMDPTPSTAAPPSGRLVGNADGPWWRSCFCFSGSSKSSTANLSRGARLQLMNPDTPSFRPGKKAPVVVTLLPLELGVESFADRLQRDATTRESFLSPSVLPKLVAVLVPCLLSVLSNCVNPLVARHANTLLLRCLSLSADLRQRSTGASLAFVPPNQADTLSLSGASEGNGGDSSVATDGLRMSANTLSDSGDGRKGAKERKKDQKNASQATVKRYVSLNGDSVRSWLQHTTGNNTLKLLKRDDDIVHQVLRGFSKPLMSAFIHTLALDIYSKFTVVREPFSFLKDDGAGSDELARLEVSPGMQCSQFSLATEQHIVAIDSIVVLLHLLKGDASAAKQGSGAGSERGKSQKDARPSGTKKSPKEWRNSRDTASINPLLPPPMKLPKRRRGNDGNTDGEKMTPTTIAVHRFETYGDLQFDESPPSSSVLRPPSGPNSSGGGTAAPGGPDPLGGSELLSPLTPLSPLASGEASVSTGDISKAKKKRTSFLKQAFSSGVKAMMSTSSLSVSGKQYDPIPKHMPTARSHHSKAALLDDDEVLTGHQRAVLIMFVSTSLEKVSQLYRGTRDALQSIDGEPEFQEARTFGIPVVEQPDGTPALSDGRATRGVILQLRIRAHRACLHHPNFLACIGRYAHTITALQQVLGVPPVMKDALHLIGAYVPKPMLKRIRKQNSSAPDPPAVLAMMCAPVILSSQVEPSSPLHTSTSISGVLAPKAVSEEDGLTEEALRVLLFPGGFSAGLAAVEAAGRFYDYLHTHKVALQTVALRCPQVMAELAEGLDAWVAERSQGKLSGEVTMASFTQHGVGGEQLKDSFPGSATFLSINDAAGGALGGDVFSPSLRTKLLQLVAEFAERIGEGVDTASMDLAPMVVTRQPYLIARRAKRMRQLGLSRHFAWCPLTIRSAPLDKGHLATTVDRPQWNLADDHTLVLRGMALEIVPASQMESQLRDLSLLPTMSMANVAGCIAGQLGSLTSGRSSAKKSTGSARSRSDSTPASVLSSRPVSPERIVVFVSGVPILSPLTTLIDAFMYYSPAGAPFRSLVQANSRMPDKGLRRSGKVADALRLMPLWYRPLDIAFVVLEEPLPAELLAPGSEIGNVSVACCGCAHSHPPYLCSAAHLFEPAPPNGLLAFYSALCQALREDGGSVDRLLDRNQRRLCSALIHYLYEHLDMFSFPPMLWCCGAGAATQSSASLEATVPKPLKPWMEFPLAPYILWRYPHVLSFSMRKALLNFFMTAEGNLSTHQASQLLDQYPLDPKRRDSEEDARTRVVGLSWITPASLKSGRVTLTVERDRPLSSCEALRSLSLCDLTLDVEFKGEAGIGSGPAREFYELLASSFTTPSTGMWRVEVVPGEESKNHPKTRSITPLYPRALQSESSLRYFEMLGYLLARLLKMGLTTSLELHPLFFARLRGESLVVTEAATSTNMHLVDAALEASLQKMERMSAEEVHSCCATFIVPCSDADGFSPLRDGTSGVELVPGGADIDVTARNVREYTALLRRYYLHTVLDAPLMRVRVALQTALNPLYLQLFTASELSTLLCSSHNKKIWRTARDLNRDVEASHGYHKQSAVVQQLIEVVASWNGPLQHAFLKFITGSSSVPCGGLSQPIMVVRRGVDAAVADTTVGSPLRPSDSSTVSCTAEDLERYKHLRCSNDTTQSFREKVHRHKAMLQQQNSILPTVSTCFLYLKLPNYTSMEVLEERLLFAVREGQSFFSLT